MAILTGREFARIGELLGGKEWKTWLGEQVGRDRRTILNYAKDKEHIPTAIRRKLFRLLADRSRELTELAARFPVTEK